MTEAQKPIVDAFGRMSVQNAAKALGKSVSCLNNWRTNGDGPRWFKVDGRVYYLWDDLRAYALGEAA